MGAVVVIATGEGRQHSETPGQPRRGRIPPIYYMVAGTLGPWLLVGVAMLVLSRQHRRAVDPANDQAELDRTVNAENLAEIARLKETLAPVDEGLAEVRKEIERVKSEPVS